MKVLFFSHQADFIYGGEICTLAFLQELRRRGHEVHFASPPGPYAGKATEVGISHEVGSVQFRREWRRLPGFAVAWLRTRRELRELIRREGIELLHATSLKSMVYCWRLGAGVPVLWHHHDILPAGRANGLWLRGLAAGASLILAPSEATRAALLAAGVGPEKAVVLRNGFRPDTWPVRGPRIAGSPLRIGVVGEISYRKGADRLGAILQELAVLPGKAEPVELVVVGEGLSDPAFAMRIKRELASAPVRFLGRVEKMQEVYQRLDLLLVPSRQDPLPTVIVEAGLSGVPVIGARAGGIPEMIVEGENGYLFSSEAEAAAAIARAAREWQRLSTGARRLAELRYDIGALTERLLSCYGAARERYTGTRAGRGRSRA